LYFDEKAHSRHLGIDGAKICYEKQNKTVGDEHSYKPKEGLRAIAQDRAQRRERQGHKE